MHPYLFEIPLPWGGTFRAASYGFMIACGFLTCLYLLRGRARRMGTDPLALFDAAVFALMGGIIGARVFYVLHHWSSYAAHPAKIIRLDEGGLTFYGGLIGGAAGLLIVIYRKRLPLLRALDVFASLVPLGHAFGRVGCFLNGCCYGKLTHSWAGVRFPQVLNKAGELIGSPPYLDQLARGLIAPTAKVSLPVHPTQLYEIVYELAFFVVLSWVLPRRRREGDVAWLYGLLYGCARFVNEFFRAGHQPLPALGGLNVFQGLSLALAAFCAAMILRSRKRPPQPLPEPWQPAGA